MLKSLKLMLGSAALLGSSLLSGAVSAQDFQWRIQSNLNAGEPGYVALEEKFAGLASEMSGGRIAFEIYPVGSLFPMKDGLEAVSAGVTEMAVLTGGYYAGKMGPIASLESGVPGSLRTPIERFNFFYKRGFLDLAREAYGAQGVYYLGPQLSPPWDIMSTKPITSQADFDGLKIRSFGLEADWYEKMGASPVFLGGGEIYTALATGVVDAARWASPAGNMNNSFHEVAKYYVQPSPMPVPNNFFAVNQAAWDGLPDDIKAILNEAAVASSLDYIMRSMNDDARAMQDMQAAGVEISTIPDAEWVAMEAEARSLWQAYAEHDDLARRGVEMLNAFLADLGRTE
ncbi:TRAP transporter substrate-binding protein DctP [Roseovarius pacificus]|uniref:TRAP transporter substrate-binding protein DctP n=1 Tax=Roseovarius pacificus TaxID=337701 RepID=UPI002A1886A3|nr:TRAP transporter substrate-binding protein DctP [Roseovarius pacificus]